MQLLLSTVHPDVTLSPSDYNDNNDNDDDNNNSTTSDSMPQFEPFRNPLDSPLIRTTLIVLYVTVFITCFTGNLLLLLVIALHKRMRTITNFFLANLAVTDLCVGVFCVLPNLSTNLSPSWPLGRVMCKAYYFVQAMSYTASISILTVISIERYVAIIYPMHSRRLQTMCLLRATVVGVWTVAAAYGVPYLLIYEQFEIPHFVGGGSTNSTEPAVLRVCVQGSGSINWTAYNTTTFILWYSVPLMLMAFVYTRISVVLWRSSTSSSSASGTRAPASSASGKSTRHGIRCVTGALSSGLIEERLTTLNESTIITTAIATDAVPSKQLSSDDDRDAQQQQEQQHDIGLISLRPQCQSDELGLSVSTVTPPSKCRSESVIGPLQCFVVERAVAGDVDRTSPESTTTEIEEPFLVLGSGPRRTEKGCRFVVGHRTSDRQSTTGRQRQTCNAKTSPYRRDGRMGVTGSTTTSDCHGDSALGARRKVIRLLIALVLAFAICVLPYHVRVLWQSYGTPDLSNDWHILITPATFIPYYFNSGLNPILYAFLSNKFRSSLVELLIGRCCRSNGRRYKDNGRCFSCYQGNNIGRRYGSGVETTGRSGRIRISFNLKTVNTVNTVAS